MNKKENAAAMEPNRFKMAKNMSVVPGGPMNNNPMNVTSAGAQPGSMTGVNQFPYGDSGLTNAPQMGADILNPMMVQNSGLQQNMPLGRGANGAIPYGMQQQPGPSGQEPMEGMRMGADAANRGLISSQFMGVTGSPALIPGAMDPSIPGQGAPLMQPMTTIDGMTPGSTPQKKSKKRGKK